MRSIEEILQDAERRGCALNNLFKGSSGSWWAEFRPGNEPGYGYSSATGAAPAEALEKALAQLPIPPTSIDELF